MPISKLPQVLLETKEDLAASQFTGTSIHSILLYTTYANYFCLAPIIGHVGDGNFHSLIMIDPENERELLAAKQLAFRMSK